MLSVYTASASFCGRRKEQLSRVSELFPPQEQCKAWSGGVVVTGGPVVIAAPLGSARLRLHPGAAALRVRAVVEEPRGGAPGGGNGGNDSCRPARLSSIRWARRQRMLSREPLPGSGEDDLLELNVGGKLMQTTRSTLQVVPGSRLAAMFRQGAEGELRYDSCGRVCLDCDPNLFQLVLRYLREATVTGAVQPADEAPFRRLLSYLEVLPYPGAAIPIAHGHDPLADDLSRRPPAPPSALPHQPLHQPQQTTETSRGSSLPPQAITSTTITTTTTPAAGAGAGAGAGVPYLGDRRRRPDLADGHHLRHHLRHHRQQRQQSRKRNWQEGDGGGGRGGGGGGGGGTAAAGPGAVRRGGASEHTASVSFSAAAADEGGAAAGDEAAAAAAAAGRSLRDPDPVPGWVEHQHQRGQQQKHEQLPDSDSGSTNAHQRHGSYGIRKGQNPNQQRCHRTRPTLGYNTSQQRQRHNHNHHNHHNHNHHPPEPKIDSEDFIPDTVTRSILGSLRSGGSSRGGGSSSDDGAHGRSEPNSSLITRDSNSNSQNDRNHTAQQRQQQQQGGGGGDGRPARQASPPPPRTASSSRQIGSAAGGGAAANDASRLTPPRRYGSRDAGGGGRGSGAADRTITKLSPLPVRTFPSISQLFYISTDYTEARGLRVSVHTEDDVRAAAAAAPAPTGASGGSAAASAAEPFDIFIDTTYDEGQISMTFVSRRDLLPGGVFLGLTSRAQLDRKGAQIPCYGWKWQQQLQPPHSHLGPQGTGGELVGELQPLWRKGDSVELILRQGQPHTNQLLLKVKGQAVDVINRLPSFRHWSWYVGLWAGGDISCAVFQRDQYAVYWGDYAVKRYL
ncbi:hypothetical protein VOLCADRAFT_89117 [Volvox carteri f. nagariensis]|uniref:Potassium channel tetramerisation-type BTB domain-containing protein n=1 Tax=Volvox carteri f. nagariensis TaxID=3068 RepID=D8TQU7_VOLCA|nr:uncharacterized protein VOLCADRAFT_89117 [Volvox carteri f. nagariensis]EFJ50095.1 hypothetical protein VOLCADRAFT_89117 [Volvox carteri f. nagariensis]|eukprot:XP_002948715.1 hypothetical protein VOLCADRAFT_89117 [Volvox carteri f. nagariensis]